jgi:formiminotetrahydrofolate cyclodeaminase
MVRSEAARYGVTIAGSEIVGLVPKRAIELTADFYLQLENFSPAQVFENRLADSLSGVAMPAAEKSGRLAAMVKPILDAVAQPTAVPGGGSVAAFSGALAASLGQMVAGLARKKKSQSAHVEALSDALAELQAAADFLATAIDRDAASFETVMASYKLPAGTPEEQHLRNGEIQKALQSAANVPMEVARKAVGVHDRLRQLEPISPPAMFSDLRVGRLMASAAALGALENVSINLDSITDGDFAKAMRSEASALAARLAESTLGATRLPS